MPRLAHALLHRARQTHPCLVPLLHVCRDLPSALNELRWFQEHVNRLSGPQQPVIPTGPPLYQNLWHKHTLQKLCAARGRGVPLQYLLGSEYFGSLELAVRPGVLIPRWETAAAISRLAALLTGNRRHVRRELGGAASNEESPLKILDLCTGSGCIPLLLRHDLAEIHTQSLGIDVSPHAIKLAKENEKTARRTTERSICEFTQADIFEDVAHDGNFNELRRVLEQSGMQHVDILVSNPPYVSPTEYTSQTERSVRNYEPRIALVPPERTVHSSLADSSADKSSSMAALDEQQGDAFYPRLLRIARLTKAKIFWCEVGGLEQAKRVVAMALEDGHFWDGVQIWRDDPTGKAAEHIEINGRRVDIVGHSHGRSVICWRSEGASWLGL